MTLGQLIQYHRTKAGLSQEGLGEKLGVTRQAVSKWEADGAVPDTDKLIALSKLFGISLNALLQVEEPKKEGGEEALPRKKKRLCFPLVCLALLVLAASVLALGIQLARLTNRVAVLEEGTSGLDPSAPLVAAFDLQYTIIDKGIQVSLSPAQIPENLTVTFAAGKAGLSTPGVKGEPNGGGWYTATLPLDPVDLPYTITAAFSDGTHTYSQALAFVSGMTGDYQPTWNSLWEEK